MPNWVVLPALLGTPAQTLRDPSSEWLLAALSVAGLLLLVAVSPVGLGMGSVKLGALLGALLGWSALVAVGIACVAVAIHLAAKLARGARFRSTAVPVPRYLALGAVVVLLVHPLS